MAVNSFMGRSLLTWMSGSFQNLNAITLKSKTRVTNDFHFVGHLQLIAVGRKVSADCLTSKSSWSEQPIAGKYRKV